MISHWSNMKLNIEKQKIEELLVQAMDHYSSGKYEEAIEIWKKILEKDPKNTQAQEGIRMAEVISESWQTEDSSSPIEDKVDISPEKEAEAPHTNEVQMDSNLEKVEEGQKSEENTQQSIEVEEETNLEIENTDFKDIEEKQEDISEETAKTDSSDEKIHGMILEAEGFIREKRYVEAIDKLSEAWALDETNGAIQDLMNIARSLLEMDNKKINDKLSRAVEHFQRNEWEVAKVIFKEIVSMNPSHVEALDYLEKIDQEIAKNDDQKIPDEDVEKKEVEAAVEQPERKGTEEANAKAVNVDEDQETLPNIEVSSTKGPRKRLRSKVLLIFIALLIIGTGLYFSKGIISGFIATDKEMKTDTISSDIKSSDKAVETELISEAPAPVQSSVEIPSPNNGAVDEAKESLLDESLTPDEIKVKVSELLREGKALVASGQSIEAEEKFKEAMILDPLSFEAKRLHEKTSRVAEEEKRRKEKIDRALRYFDEEFFEEALKILYRLPKNDKEPIIGYILNSWYNLGVFHLIAGNVIEADKCFDEVLHIRSNDKDALKEKKITEWYSSHRIDKSFHNHIKSLTYRKLTD